MPEPSEHVFSVSDLARYIQSLISENVPRVWVRGEISNFTVRQNGNAYFSLKDDQAKINAIIMHYSPAHKFLSQLKEGIEIMALANISYYVKEGIISAFVENIELVGIGLLKERFDKLKQKLEQEGLFDKSHKLPIPKYPQTVGIVTSPTGAAIRDILNVTHRRFQSVNLVIFPAAVQGEHAAHEIARAIRMANIYAKNMLDVLIVTRGGGSLEDLWCFNEEIVARAIYESEIPIISAVGHEIDYTIADYVADYRAPTPSAAAEIVVKDHNELLNYINNLKARMNQIINNQIENYRLKLKNHGSFALKRIMQTMLSELSMQLDNLKLRFQTQLRSHLTNLRYRINLQREKLEVLNPKNILARGYSITYLEKNDHSLINLRSATNVKSGDKIKTVLYEGELTSTVN